MSSVGNLSREHMNNARMVLTRIFGKDPEQMNEITFSAAGEDGVNVNLGGLRIGGFADDNKKWDVEKALKRGFNADVVCTLPPDSKVLQGLIVRSGDMEGSVKAIGGIGQQGMNDLKTELDVIKRTRSDRPLD